MPALASKPFASPLEGESRQRGLSALLAQALLAGCASPPLGTGSAASEEASKRGNDSWACSASNEPLTGLLGESMLLGLTVGGGPAVIESGNAANRKAFKKCMEARRTEPL